MAGTRKSRPAARSARAREAPATPAAAREASRPPAAGSGVRRAAAGLALAALAVFLLAPMLLYPFGSDQGSFAPAAEVIGRGGRLYRDVFEIKPPGVYYLFWAGFALLGHSTVAIRLLDLCWTLAAAGLLFLAGRRLVSEVTAAAGALFFVASYAVGFDFWHTAQCDGFTSLPLAAAVLLALAAAASRPAPRDLRSAALATSAGLCVGLAILLKFTVGGALALPVALALAASQVPLRARLTRAAWCLAGCLLPVAATVALLARAGTLHDMLQIVINWNAAYGRIRPPGPQVGVAIYQVGRFLFGGQYLLQKLVGLLAVLGFVAALRERRQRSAWWLAPAWLALMLAGIIAQGKYYAYHWLPALLPLGLAAGEGLVFGGRLLVGPFTAPTRRLGTIAVGAVLLALTAGAVRGQFGSQFSYLAGRLSTADYEAQFATPDGYFSFPVDVAVAKYVQEHTRAGEPISVFGLQPLIYFLAERPPATRFIHAIPLLTPWSPPEWRRQHVQQLRAVRPRLILLVHNDAQSWTTGWEGDSYSALPTYPDLTALLRTSYRPVGRIEDFEIWKLREEGRREWNHR